jgi:hypothetical protein
MQKHLVAHCSPRRAGIMFIVGVNIVEKRVLECLLARSAPSRSVERYLSSNAEQNIVRSGHCMRLCTRAVYDYAAHKLRSFSHSFSPCFFAFCVPQLIAFG